jgi:hypothetical protein
MKITHYDGAAPISAPGFYDMPAAIYHADPCVTPSLSHSVAKEIIDDCPAEAAQAHSKLRIYDSEEEKSVDAREAGSAIHKLILQKGADVVIIPFDDYRKKEAQELRDAAYAAHRIPIKQSQFGDIRRCANVALEQMRDDPALAGFFGPNAVSEVVLIAYLDGVLCRSMVDRLNLDTGEAYDIKSTMLSTAPWRWEKRFREAYATQDAFYRRMLKALGLPKVPPITFIPVKQKPAYRISVMQADSLLHGIAEDEVNEAIAEWRRCLAAGKWSGYGKGVHVVGPTQWQLERAEEARFEAAANRKEQPSEAGKKFAANELGIEF